MEEKLFSGDSTESVNSLVLDQSLGSLGATKNPDGSVLFRVWAPKVSEVFLELSGDSRSPILMIPEGNGYHHSSRDGIRRGQEYRFCLGQSGCFPDPASRWQPSGVHSPSAVWFPDPSFPSPLAGWKGHSLESLLFYELHVGTFSREGSFEGVIAQLDHLADLGITALEIMPVAAFPGDRNWGYDGVYPFAVQESYGGPDGFGRLVRAAHERGLSVILDVVYNHLGPEGNYLGQFGPYFTHTTRTPWGDAINMEETGSDHVRHYFLENIRYWVRVFDVDGFRLDAIHAIRDQSPVPFLTDLSRLALSLSAEKGRRIHLIGESHSNDRRTVLPEEVNGIGLSSQWSDDFHHALHVTLTGEAEGYYQDFRGVADLPAIVREGFLYQGQYAPSFGRRRGSSPWGLSGASFVVFSQNHDQVGNRALADRMSSSLSFEKLRFAAAFTILSPFLPLLFMGEEFGEPNPFHYFTSHGDTGLIEAVREGRKREFSQFSWTGEVPDPQDPGVFQKSKLSGIVGESRTEEAKRLLAFYRELIRLRKDEPALSPPRVFPGPPVKVLPGDPALLTVLREGGGERCLLFFHLASTESVSLETGIALPGDWERVIDSEEERFGGSGETLPILLSAFGDRGRLLPFQSAVYRERRP